MQSPIPMQVSIRRDHVALCNDDICGSLCRRVCLYAGSASNSACGSGSDYDSDYDSEFGSFFTFLASNFGAIAITQALRLTELAKAELKLKSILRLCGCNCGH